MAANNKKATILGVLTTLQTGTESFPKLLTDNFPSLMSKKYLVADKPTVLAMVAEFTASFSNGTSIAI